MGVEVATTADATQPTIITLDATLATTMANHVEDSVLAAED